MPATGRARGQSALQKNTSVFCCVFLFHNLLEVNKYQYFVVVFSIGDLTVEIVHLT